MWTPPTGNIYPVYAGRRGTRLTIGGHFAGVTFFLAMDTPVRSDNCFYRTYSELNLSRLGRNFLIVCYRYFRVVSRG